MGGMLLSSAPLTLISKMGLEKVQQIRDLINFGYKGQDNPKKCNKSANALTN